jgi:hypothetical protein
VKEAPFGISKVRRPLLWIKQTTPTIDFIAPSTIIPSVAVSVAVAGLSIIAPCVYPRIVSPTSIISTASIISAASVISATGIIPAACIVSSGVRLGILAGIDHGGAR